MLEIYYDQIKSGKISDNPLAMETEFEIPIAGTTLVGKIDRIDFEDGEYEVSDYKSGKTKPDAFELRNNLQLTAYYWACFELYGKYPKKLYWHHLRTGDRMETERTAQDVENLKVMIQNAVYIREKGIRHRVFHEKVCDLCEYKSQICTDYQLEQNLLAGA